MRHLGLFNVVLYIVVYAGLVKAFATFMTEEYCDRKLVVGVEIMAIATEESDQRLIVVKKGNESIENNTVVSSLDGLTVELSPKTTQTLLEVDSTVAMFKDGKCSGQRVLKSGELQARESSIEGRHEVKIKAGWSTSYAVKLAPTFTLFYEPSHRTDL
ncbi:hypothetical protein EON65_25520 [archaeon]|nr:MAG: hypothetical protein EON65_25520 [archaeon]